MAAANITDSPDKSKMLAIRKTTQEDKIELIPLGIHYLKAYVSSVLQKLELYLKKDETRATEIQRLSTVKPTTKKKCRSLGGPDH